MIRLVTAEGEEVTPPPEERREVALTPAPGYVEAEGRRVLLERGWGNGIAKEDREEDKGLLEEDVRFCTLMAPRDHAEAREARIEAERTCA